jgi:hypothetical protein
LRVPKRSEKLNFDDSSLKDIDVGMDEEAEEKEVQPIAVEKSDEMAMVHEMAALALKQQLRTESQSSPPSSDSPGEPTLDDCRKVLRFLSSRAVPVATYMLRTFNGFQSERDIAHLLDSISADQTDNEICGTLG